MKNKPQRLEAIRDLVTNHRLSNQEELLDLLHLKGFPTTQATLSRDLKALKIAKQPGMEGGYIYVLPEVQDREQGRVGPDTFPVNAILTLEFSGNMVLIRTRPGFANSTAVVIDNENPREVLGTIAGDDTILLIIREGVSRPDLMAGLSKFMPGIKNKLV